MAKSRKPTKAPHKPAKAVAPKKATWGGARKGSGGRRRKSRTIKDYAELGDAPADELEAMSWMFKALGVRARQVMTDAEMTDKDRGVELRTNAKVMNQLMPKVRLWRAENALRKAKARQDATVVVKLEPAPTATTSPPTSRAPEPPKLEPAPPAKEEP